MPQHTIVAKICVLGCSSKGALSMRDLASYMYTICHSHSVKKIDAVEKAATLFTLLFADGRDPPQTAAAGSYGHTADNSTA